MKHEEIESYYVENLLRYTDTEERFCDEYDVRKLESDYIELEKNIEKAYSVISMYGIPKERAVTLHNGIDVLMTRIKREAESKDYELSTTKETLQDAIGALEGVMIDANESWCTCSSEEGDGCYYHDAIEILYKIKGSK